MTVNRLICHEVTVNISVYFTDVPVSTYYILNWTFENFVTSYIKRICNSISLDFLHIVKQKNETHRRREWRTGTVTERTGTNTDAVGNIIGYSYTHRPEQYLVELVNIL
jgi:hypothetical protein